ncbi:HNH endonuclease [Massilia sp. TWR1-2-2]|uniref:HNH endonuclease n=1 Tax=Massilia sp. TWR1-2-2 TaxID=2804584 RepID=UPI003CF0D306
MKFEDWLTAEGLSTSTIKKYVGAIVGRLSEWGKDASTTSKPLREVTDLDEFRELSELIEKTEIFSERNIRGNHMYGAALNNYERYLEHLANEAAIVATVGPFADELNFIEHTEAALPPFQPNDKEDARRRVLQNVVRRQGQPKFRAGLVDAYNGRCAITQCAVLVALEAAHVTPYLGPKTNSICNGLLLRADIHTLWDLKLIAIDPSTMAVLVNPALQDANYQALAGSPLFQPVAVAARPSMSALEYQWQIFQTHLESSENVDM